jgi:hypothetical protein
MNPTLSERLRARRTERYWRVHPPQSWLVPLETPLALQALEACPSVASPQPPTVPRLSDIPESPEEAPVMSTAPATFRESKADPHKLSLDPPHEELVLLLLTAMLWLVEGWRALQPNRSACESPTFQGRRPYLPWSGRSNHRNRSHPSASLASAATSGVRPCQPIRTPSPAAMTVG